GLELAAPGGGHGAVHLGDGEAVAAEAVGLVLHQRDERRDDEGGGGAAQLEGWQLVAEALAGAGGHDDQDVASGDGGSDGLGLAGAEALEPEVAFELGLQTLGGAGRGGGGGAGHPGAFRDTRDSTAPAQAMIWRGRAGVVDGPPHYTRPAAAL